MNHIFDFTRESFTGFLGAAGGMERFRAGQILQWVYERGVIDPHAMTNLSKLQREWLADHVRFLSGEVVRDQLASDGTRKLLVRWTDVDDAGFDASDGAPGRPANESNRSLSVLSPRIDSTAAEQRETECVMIPSDSRRTACVSSQVGCPVGCRFCASGIGGLEGNLSAGRIVEQVWRLNRELLDGGERITNVVFMGMGEPLANYNAVVHAIHTLMAPWAFGIGGRRITVSTVGLPAAIRRFAKEDLPVTLALSLHAPNDEIRRSIIPWAEYATVAELLEACQEYFKRTGREITLEYTLIHDVNDRAEHAKELAAIAKTLRANVNLIRYNEVADLPFERPADEDVRRFQEILRAGRINTHIRASRGRDIAAACGQLRHERRSAEAPLRQ